MSRLHRISSLRVRALILLILPVLGLASLFTPIFEQTASAIDAGTIRKKGDVWRGISEMLQNPGALQDQISVQDAESCKFTGPAVRRGPVLQSNNLATVGMTCVDFIKALGYSVPSGGQSTYNKPANFSKDSMLSALSAKGIPQNLYGGNLRDGNPPDGLVYDIALKILKEQCSVGFRTELLNPIPGYTTDAGNNQRVDWMKAGGGNSPLNSTDADNATDYHFWMYTHENGKVSKNIYYAGDTMDDYFTQGYGIETIARYQTDLRDADAPYDIDCYQAARLLQDNNKYANAYAQLLAEAPGTGQTPGTCEERFTAEAERAACVAGFTNKADPNYCRNTYSGANLAACEYGSKTATAATGVTAPVPIDEGKGEEKVTCAIVGIGWVICPVLSFLAEIVDGAYKFVSALLVVQPLLSVPGSDSAGVYDAWSNMRNFANVAFVMAFMFIIFSQITSVGINNYGIKKMLPKLIVAAILVNISYWLCAIAVDLSNILGGSINGLLKGIGENGLVNGPNADDFGATGSTAGGWVAITTFVLAGGALLATGMLYVALAALLPALATVASAILVTFVILTIRQGLIILLIVVSPLAFVAYLLPNTEPLFKKWRSLFQVFLIMYPIISLIFGASALASTIIMKSATGDFKIAVQIMGAVVAILPLLIVPALIKAATGVLNRIGLGGFVNGINLNGMKKKAEGYRDYKRDQAKGNRVARAKKILDDEGGGLGGQYSRRRRVAAYLSTAGATRDIDRDKKRGFAKAVSDQTSQEYFAKRAISQDGFANKVAGNEKFAAGLKASAQSEVDKMLHQDVENREKLLSVDPKYRNNPQDALNAALKSGDHVQARAATNMLMKTGASGFDKIHDSVAAAEANGASASVMENMKDHVKDYGKDIKGKDPALTAWAAEVQPAGTPAGTPPPSLADVAARNSTFDKSDAEIAGFAPKAFEDAVKRGLITPARADAIRKNQSLYKDVSPQNKAFIEAIATGSTPPPYSRP